MRPSFSCLSPRSRLPDHRLRYINVTVDKEIDNNKKMGEYMTVHILSQGYQIELKKITYSQRSEWSQGTTDTLPRVTKPRYMRPVVVLFFFSSLSFRFSFKVCWGFFFCCFLPLSALPEPAISASPSLKIPRIIAWHRIFVGWLQAFALYLLPIAARSG